MAHSVHPIDQILENSIARRERVVEKALEHRDATAATVEALRAIDEMRHELKLFRERQYAADAFVRNGPSRHTQASFKDAGAKLVSLEEYRNSHSPSVA